MDILKNDLHMFLTYCAQNETEQNEELSFPALNSVVHLRWTLSMNALFLKGNKQNEIEVRFEACLYCCYTQGVLYWN